MGCGPGWPQWNFTLLGGGGVGVGWEAELFHDYSISKAQLISHSFFFSFFKGANICLALIMGLVGILEAQTVKNLPAVWETWVRSWEDPMEKGMATHSSILAWRIPWTGEPGRLQSMGLQRVGHDWATNTYIYGLGMVLGTLYPWYHWTPINPAKGLHQCPVWPRRQIQEAGAISPRSLSWCGAEQCCPNNRLHWHFKVISGTFYSSIKL